MEKINITKEHKEVVYNYPNNCPFCFSEEIVRRKPFVDIEGNDVIMTVEVMCRHCHIQYKEKWSLTGISDAHID